MINCIGALDNTHIHTSVPNDIVTHFHGKNPYTTQNVLAAINFEIRFTYVLAGWECSTYDAFILLNVLEREDGLVMIEGFLSLYQN